MELKTSKVVGSQGIHHTVEAEGCKWAFVWKFDDVVLERSRSWVRAYSWMPTLTFRIESDQDTKWRQDVVIASYL